MLHRPWISTWLNSIVKSIISKTFGILLVCWDCGHLFGGKYAFEKRTTKNKSRKVVNGIWPTTFFYQMQEYPRTAKKIKGFPRMPKKIYEILRDSISNWQISIDIQKIVESYNAPGLY